MARTVAQKLYLGVASLILLGIVSEGVLIGPSLFAAMHWGRTIHGGLGVVLFGLSLLLPVLGWLARLPGSMILVNGVLCVLALLELTSAALGRKVPLLAALHPATALVMVALTVVLFMHGWHLAREKKGEMNIERGPRA